MKTFKEVLSEKYNIDEKTVGHNYDYLFKSILSAMEDFSSQDKMINEQLDKWIEGCQIQADLFFERGMTISETSSLAMKVAYMNVKSLINKFNPTT